MIMNTTRRGLLAGIPAVAALTLPAIPLIQSNDDDAALIEAFNRRQRARAEYNALPDDKWVLEDGYTPEEARLWAIVDEAEEQIRSAVAKTLQGVMIQIWIALAHTVGGREDDNAITRGDLDQLLAKEEAFDWNARLALAALRSLKAMGA
jgi:hypothetical protein